MARVPAAVQAVRDTGLEKALQALVAALRRSGVQSRSLSNGGRRSLAVHSRPCGSGPVASLGSATAEEDPQDREVEEDLGCPRHPPQTAEEERQ